MPPHIRQFFSAALLVALVSTTAPAHAGQDQYLLPLDPSLAEDLEDLFIAERDRLRQPFVDPEPPPTRRRDCTTAARPLRNPPERAAVSHLLDTRLRVSYAEHQVCNPALHREVTLRVRSYENGLVGPTLRVQPGTLLRVRIQNDLPLAAPDPTATNTVDPQSFNMTNLHTHGLHVSPAGNSDNVLLRIAPQTDFVTEIYIPEDHPPGTFWYHAHVHGSTAIQVSSGMAGALIVDGGLDHAPEIREADEKILVFQQMPYTPDPENADVHVIEDFDASFGRDSWPQGVRDNGWRTTINGQTYPVIHMRPGEVQRWRMVHAGVRETISVTLEDHELHEIAVDGIALGRIVPRPAIELQPGYRSDVLVRAGPARQAPYFLYDGRLPPTDALFLRDEPPNILAMVVVAGEEVDMPFPTSDSLAPYAPFAPIDDDQIAGTQEVVFNIETGSRVRFQINGRSFDADGPARQLSLGTAEEWTLRSRVANHPYHIHVNPFQVVSITRSGHELLDAPIWRDTILVKQADVVTIRTRYRRYIGRFVIHCHILDHEDQGMMELVEIVP